MKLRYPHSYRWRKTPPQVRIHPPHPERVGSVLHRNWCKTLLRINVSSILGRASLLLPSMQLSTMLLRMASVASLRAFYAPYVARLVYLDKDGFVREGRLREHRVGRDGVFMDELLFGRIRREPILDDASTAE